MRCLIQIAVLLAAFGCANSGPQRSAATVALTKVDDKIAEKAASQVHATGVALQAAPQTNRAVQIAQTFNEKAKALLPQPNYEDTVKYQEIVAGLLSTNANQRLEAQGRLQEKDTEISALQSERRAVADRVSELESKLIDLGSIYEKEKNKSWWSRIYAALGVGGLIALALVFPVIIPIGGHLIGWLVSAVPALASACGVVGKRAFDSVLTAVQKSKEQMAASEHTEALAVLKNELSKATDASHRRLISTRKGDLDL